MKRIAIVDENQLLIDDAQIDDDAPLPSCGIDIDPGDLPFDGSYFWQHKERSFQPHRDEPCPSQEKIIFDLDENAFFASIQNTYSSYQDQKIKSTENILYVVMGLNHLREWIAPGYKKRYPKGEQPYWPLSDTPEKLFSKKIYENQNFTVIREICNKSKHVTSKEIHTDTRGGLLFDEWPEFDQPNDFDNGPVTRHMVNGNPIETVVDPVMELYSNWFKSKNIKD